MCERFLVIPLINPDTASLLWVGEGQATTGKSKAGTVGTIVGAVSGAFLGGGDKDDRIAGGVIGGVLGGVVGEALNPDEDEMLRKLIKTKVCKNLPSCI